eukprot:m.108260 g.108260  ORF g.108260 m.108260 type:complete len:83 (+) comp15211_c0_seq2:5355-5603(+)
MVLPSTSSSALAFLLAAGASSLRAFNTLLAIVCQAAVAFCCASLSISARQLSSCPLQCNKYLSLSLFSLFNCNGLHEHAQTK